MCCGLSLDFQQEMARCCTEISRGECEVTVVRTVEEAIQLASTSNTDTFQHPKPTVLITGSVHFIGSAMDVLDVRKARE